MKRIIAFVLSISLLMTACADAGINTNMESSQNKSSVLIEDEDIKSIAAPVEEVNANDNDIKELIDNTDDEKEEIEEANYALEENFAFAQEEPVYTGLNDPELLPYLEDTIYKELVSGINDDGYFVENVQAIYISKEYLEEYAYNSQTNIYFGYSLDDLESQFQGEKYVFTLGNNGETIVEPFSGYVDPYDQVIKNVAIGTGVILVCVTVSAVTAGAGAPAVSMIFAASAKTGTIMALSGGAFGGIAAGVVTGIQTKDFNKAVEAAAVAGSEGFKWGAFTGAIAGGAGEAIALKGATLNGLTMNEAAMIQKQSGYPLDVIKEFSSMEQYEICKNGGLSAEMVNGKMALVRQIDLKNVVDEMGRTNAQRIQQGLSPLDPSGIPYELHHIGQKTDSTLAILTRSEHRLGGNSKIWHEVVEAGEGVHAQISEAAWGAQREMFWTKYLELATKGVAAL